MRLVALAAVALAAVALVALVALTRERATPAGAARAQPLLAVEAERGLVRVDPLSLRPLDGRRVRLGAPVEGWARSPDGLRLATVSGRGSVLRVIDVERMRPLARLPTGARGAVAAVQWPQPDRAWVVLARPGCCALGSTTVVTVDPLARHVVARRRLAAGLARVAATPDGPVLLLAPSALIGPATLATARADGRVGLVPLDGMSAGVLPTEGVPFIEHVRVPALAVDAGGRRAYVVSSRPHAVEVDLRRGTVRHHRLIPRTVPLDRLRELVPRPRGAPAPATAPSRAGGRVGRVRSAAWIGAGRLALSGHDGHVEWRADGGVRAGRRPAGLRLVHTRDWTIRTLDERAGGFRAAAGLLLARGPGGRGLAAYAPDGRGEFLVLGHRRADLAAVAGSLAYVRTPPARGLHVIDLVDGRVLATLAAGRPRLLAEIVPRGWE